MILMTHPALTTSTVMVCTGGMRLIFDTYDGGSLSECSHSARVKNLVIGDGITYGVAGAISIGIVGAVYFGIKASCRVDIIAFVTPPMILMGSSSRFSLGSSSSTGMGMDSGKGEGGSGTGLGCG
ncbi:hypothetical protein RJT34_12713 [Clitoria ternatea]|uniref:Uncharacterized protein n=1 Tax=Clitoria ternatea TaxID=43366 RepID=A0AAN9JQC1_CLITE